MKDRIPKEILNEGLLSGMMIVGTKFKNNEVFVPEVLVDERAMNAGAGNSGAQAGGSGEMSR